MTYNKKKNVLPTRIEKGAGHQVIHTRNLLKAKAAVIGEGPMAMDETAIRRAELALQALSKNFDNWMNEASEGLYAAHEEIKLRGPSSGRGEAFQRAAHDIRGQATTLGFPLASRVAASLCMMLENCEPAVLADARCQLLIDKHVDAIRAITREGITKSNERTGETLTKELESISQLFLAAVKPQTLN
jgi:chemotaxis protein histidine kinase CheA